MTANLPVVLYVEDDKNSLDIMRITLEVIMELPRVHYLENSENFMERVRAFAPQPDVFLLDIHMEPVDGFAMLTQLRADPAYAQSIVIALTASVMNEEVRRLRTAGFNSVIAKPVDIDAFPTQLSRIISGNPVWTV